MSFVKRNADTIFKVALAIGGFVGLLYVLQMDEIKLYENPAIGNFTLQGIPLGKRLKFDGPFAAASVLLALFFMWQIAWPHLYARLKNLPRPNVMRPRRFFMAGCLALFFGLFVYSYMNYRMDRAPRQIIQTTDHIVTLAFNQDGSRLAVSDANGNAYIMDADGRHKVKLAPAYQQNFQAVAYSPFGDMLAVGGTDGNISLWNAEGTTFKRQLLGKHGAVSQLAMGTWMETDARGQALNKIILVAGFDSGDLTVWKINRDGADETTILDQTRVHALSVTALALDPSNRFLATGGADYQIRLFDLARQQLVYDFEGHPYPIQSLEFMPLDNNRLRLSSVSAQGKVESWVLPTRVNHNSQIAPEFMRDLTRVDQRPDRMNLTAAAFSPAAQIYATAEGPDLFKPANDAVKGRIFLRDYPYGCRYDLLELPDTVTRLAFDPAGNYLVTGETSGEVRIWQLARVSQTAYDAQNKIACPQIALSPRVKYKIQAHPQAFTLSAASPNVANDIQALAWNRNSARPMVAAVDRNKVVHICTAFDFQQPAECHELRGARDDITQLAFGPIKPAAGAGAAPTTDEPDLDEQVRADELITLSREGIVRQWIRSGSSAVMQRELIWKNSAINALAVNPTQPLVALGNADGAVRLWNTATAIYADSRQHPAEVSALGFSADGKQMASGDSQGNVYLWNVDPSKAKALVQAVLRADAPTQLENAHLLRVSALAFSPNGQYLVTASVNPPNQNQAERQQTVRVWRTQPKRELVREFFVTGIEFTKLLVAQDNRYFVGAGDDENLYLFDLAAENVQPQPIESLSRNIMAIALDADNQIITAAPDGTKIQQYTSVDMDERTTPGLHSPAEEWLMRSPAARVLAALLIPAAFFAGFLWLAFKATNKTIADFHFAANKGIAPHQARQYVTDVREGKPLLTVAVRGNKIENLGTTKSPKLGGPGILMVDEGYAAILERGGSISRVVGSGTFSLEQGEVVAMPVALYARNLTVNVKDVLTRDQMLFKKITIVVRHKVQGARDLAGGAAPLDPKTKRFEFDAEIIRYKIWTPEHSDYTKTIENYVIGQVRDLAGEEYFEDLYTGGAGTRKALIRTLRERVVNKMLGLGIEIETLSVTEIELEERMVKALQDRKHAELDRQVKIARAQTRRDAMIIQQDAKTALRDALLRQIADPLRDKHRGVILDSEIAVRYIEAIERLSLNFIQDDLWELKKDEMVDGTVVARDEEIPPRETPPAAIVEPTPETPAPTTP